MARLFDNISACSFGLSSKGGVYAVCILAIKTKRERIVYIGSSKNMHKRVYNPGHVYRKLFDRLLFPDYLVYTKEIVTDDYIQQEKNLIKEYKPLLNKQYKHGEKIHTTELEGAAQA